MAKYTYEQLAEQIRMVARDGKTDISKLRVFYPQAGWTELRNALKNLSAQNVGIVYHASNNTIEVQ